MVARDLKSKMLIERARREEDRISAPSPRIEFGGVMPERHEVTDADLAERLGLTESDSIDLSAIQAQKDELRKLIMDQRAKYNSTREAFLEWQAGQREKGSALRLYRQGLRAEGTKQLYAQSAGARLMSVAYYSELGDNTNNDANGIVAERMLPRRDTRRQRSGLISVVRKRQ